jgi:hypothetical protein
LIEGSIKGILVGTTNSDILDQRPHIKGILVGTTNSGILDQRPSIKGIMVETTSSGDPVDPICQNLWFLPGFT